MTDICKDLFSKHGAYWHVNRQKGQGTEDVATDSRWRAGAKDI